MKRYGQRKSEQQKIRQLIERRRRMADISAYRRAKAYTEEVELIERKTIILRDGQCCYLCGVELSIHEVTLDHVVALANGGSHTEDNLRVACRECNSRKGSK